MIYYQVNNSIQGHSLCFISNDLTHDADMVCEVIKHTIDFAKRSPPFDINEVHYFSDGCAGQFKNCKNMLNQTYYFKDFSIKATWSFLGKSHCDGIGGTIKRLTTTESLQQVCKDQILTARDTTKFCQEKVLNERKIPTAPNNPRKKKLSLF